jgi:hypothetical protein
MENQVRIYSTIRESEAITLRDKLALEGITATILNKKDSSYGTFGEIEIHVQPADVEKARAIIHASNE